MNLKAAFISAAITGMFGTVAVIATAQPATARIVCNSYGDCWHTEARYDYDRYDRDQHPQYHNDDWYFHQRWSDDHDHHYRDYHDGRGYYKNGIWLSF